MAKGGKKGGRKQFTNVEELERERGGRRKAGDDSESESDGDDDKPTRGTKGQSTNAGMLPPNSSDEEDAKRACARAPRARLPLELASPRLSPI
jgi:hypothetical protein